MPPPSQTRILKTPQCCTCRVVLLCHWSCLSFRSFFSSLFAVSARPLVVGFVVFYPVHWNFVSFVSKTHTKNTRTLSWSGGTKHGQTAPESVPHVGGSVARCWEPHLPFGFELLWRAAFGCKLTYIWLQSERHLAVCCRLLMLGENIRQTVFTTDWQELEYWPSIKLPLGLGTRPPQGSRAALGIMEVRRELPGSYTNCFCFLLRKNKEQRKNWRDNNQSIRPAHTAGST